MLIFVNRLDHFSKQIFSKICLLKIFDSKSVWSNELFGPKRNRQSCFYFHQIFQNWFLIQEMESSKQEMNHLSSFLNLEALHIRRRVGAGAILNSRSKFNQCHIARLQLGGKDETAARRKQEEEHEVPERTEEHLKSWEQAKTMTKLQTQHHSRAIYSKYKVSLLQI